MPRGADGRLANERPGQAVVDEALQWLEQHKQQPFFLWVHLFEPHSPYGNPQDPERRSVRRARGTTMRSPKPIARSARLLEGLGDDAHPQR